MKAAVAHTIPSTELRIEDVPEPQPTGNELLIELEACGICGTDLHILDGVSYRPTVPFILGHEPVGTVIGVASTDDERWIGRRVAASIFRGCAECELCRRGDERLCPQLRSIIGVFNAQGGFAERMAVAAAQVSEVPESLSSPEAAALVDSGATAVNAVRVALDVAPKRAVIAGAGPLGFLVAELLRTKDVGVEVVQPSPRRRLALQQQGHQVVASPSELSLAPDVVIDCSGSPSVLPWALELLEPQGVFIAAGYSIVPELDMAQVARKELAIRGVRSGTRADLAVAMDAAASGSIRTPRLETWPLQGINTAFLAVRSSLPGKAVIVMQN